MSAAGDDEVRAMIDAAETELARRLEQGTAVPSSRQTVEERPAPGGCYRLELVRCGKCSRCEDGPAHGPYWYWYGYRGGKAVSRYIGKELRPVDEPRGQE